MKILESAPAEIDPRVQKILDASPSSNYMLRQMQLSVEKFINENPDHPLDYATIEQIGMAWADSDDSKKFSSIAHHSDFKSHPKFQGDVANVTLEDMERGVDELF
jgi:hypothetical protein